MHLAWGPLLYALLRVVHLFPNIASSLFPLIVAGSGVGELPLILWLLIRGVDVERWRAIAAQADRPGSRHMAI